METSISNFPSFHSTQHQCHLSHQSLRITSIVSIKLGTMQYYTFLYNTIQYHTLHYNSCNTKQYDTSVCKMPYFVYLVKRLLLHLPSKRRKCSATLFRAASLCRAWKKVENQNGGQDKDEFTRPGRSAHRKSQFHSSGPRQKLQKK